MENKMKLRGILLGLVMSGLSSLALCSDAPAEPAAGGDIENITVTGQRPSVLRRLMLDFVMEIGNPVGGNFGRGFARWRDKVCVGIHNLSDARSAQYLADRITSVALDVGLKTGEPGCEPNLNVIFSTNGRDMATRLAESSPSVLRPFGGVFGTNQGLQALEEFKTSEAPVRWWQVTMIVDEHGYAATEVANGNYGPPVVRSGGPSFLKTSDSDAIWGSYAIVDASKLNGAQLPQLADYLAMVSLAQIDPGSLPSSDSILNLFKAARPASGLTEMDRSYLKALYSIDTMMIPAAQRGILANAMLRARVYGEE